MTASSAPEGVTAHTFIGDRIAIELRRSRHTAKELAMRLGVDPSTISKKMRGTRPWDIDELLSTASWLGVDVGEFLPARADAVEPPNGIEPLTYALRGRRSTD